MIGRRIGIALFCMSSTVLLPLAFAKQQPVAVAIPSDGKPLNVPASPTDLLGGPERYLTHISTDKPIYRAGEKVFMRGVLLHAINHKPMVRQIPIAVKVKGPKGDIVNQGRTTTTDSVWSFEWQVPTNQASGEYTVQVFPQGYSPAERKFDVRGYRAPRLNSHITFLRDGYGPGETVKATLEVKRAEGGIPTGAKVTVNPMVDGTPLPESSATVDDSGLCTVSFDLPKEIAHGDGTLALAVQDGGVLETTSKTIPIILNTVDIAIYPEGGDLVGGFKNRVYVQALQPNGKPADIEATIIAKDDTDNLTATRSVRQSRKSSSEPIVASMHTEHEGRGRFEFTPSTSKKYFLKVAKPSGIAKLYELPKVKAEGAILTCDQDIFKKGQPIKLQIGSTRKNTHVTITKHDVVLATCRVDGAKSKGTHDKTGLTNVTLITPPDSDGVLAATVWDQNGMPLAERLIYREQAKPLNIAVTLDKNAYVPGDDAKVTVKATDADGKPVSAIVGLSVTDESVLQMVEKRDRAPKLPVMVLLEPEVKDLADAEVYLDPNNPKAQMATDLLLGTQGWRRFALVDVNKFLETHGDLARRALAFKANSIWRGNQKGIYPFAADFRGRGALLFDTRPRLPEEIGRVEGPRDINMFQVEPTVLDERYYSSGRAERHQKTSPTLPEGAPLPDDDDLGASLSAFDRYTFYAGNGVPSYGMVREYAHKVRPNRNPNDRADFTETLYWNALVKTDPKTGEGTASFGLNDSVTTFTVTADGFTESGSVGGITKDLKSIQPFYAETKMPLEVTAGDKILMPVSLINSTIDKLQQTTLKVDITGPLKLLGLLQPADEIAGDKRVRYLQPIEVGNGDAIGDLTVQANAGKFADKVTRHLNIKPSGFPAETTCSGVIARGQKVSMQITVPDKVAPQSVCSNMVVYPSPLANLTSALERLIQDPYGCFEQTSSTSYPLTMAQQYFLTHSGVSPKLIEAAKEKLGKGYERLVSFRCADRGYEWFGQNPGHPALTAYGLLQFTDMAKVREVDRNMMATTRKWLMDRRDGKGGFSRSTGSSHSWAADKDSTDAYILWALLEVGQNPKDLSNELEQLKVSASKSDNSYVVALAANALYLGGETVSAKQLMDRLAKLQKLDGSVDKVKASIVTEFGESLAIEGTSLATLAWLREPQYAGNAERSIKYLIANCKDGRYGSTQSTVLALRSILEYDRQHAHPKESGKLRVYVDGQSIGDWVAFNKNAQESIKLPDVSEALTSGTHKIELEMLDGSEMPYSLAVKYNTLTPTSDKDCKVDLHVQFAQDKLVEGASTEAKVTVENLATEAVPSPVAIIGLPGGLEPRHDQLKELVKRGSIAAYEVLGREVILYWRSIDAKEKIELPISLVAAIPGTYTGPASRAYLYYADEHKDWVDGARVEIAARE